MGKVIRGPILAQTKKISNHVSFPIMEPTALEGSEQFISEGEMSSAQRSEKGFLKGGGVGVVNQLYCFT